MFFIEAGTHVFPQMFSPEMWLRHNEVDALFVINRGMLSMPVVMMDIPSHFIHRHNLLHLQGRPRSTTDSIEVSEAFDSGSIPDEATKGHHLR